MDIIFATGNRGKLREAADILGEGFSLHTPAEFGITEEIEETGTTLEENSLIKAKYIYDKTGKNCFADDTGLEVEALGGAPGVYSARYAGEGHDFSANIDKLLAELAARPGCDRKARFRSVVTLILDGEVHTFEGVMTGRIAYERSGTAGFGYDPVFIADEFPGGTVAEVGDEAKNQISHRGKTLRAMADFLKKI